MNWSLRWKMVAKYFDVLLGVWEKRHSEKVKEVERLRGIVEIAEKEPLADYGEAFACIYCGLPTPHSSDCPYRLAKNEYTGLRYQTGQEMSQPKFEVGKKYPATVTARDAVCALRSANNQCCESGNFGDGHVCCKQPAAVESAGSPPAQQFNEEVGKIAEWIKARKSAQVYLTREEAAVFVHAYTYQLRERVGELERELVIRSQNLDYWKQLAESRSDQLGKLQLEFSRAANDKLSIAPAEPGPCDCEGTKND